MYNSVVLYTVMLHMPLDTEDPVNCLELGVCFLVKAFGRNISDQRMLMLCGSVPCIIPRV